MVDGPRSLYSVLGLAPDAPHAVIKAAYRALAKQYHPDGAGAGNPEAAAKFIELPMKAAARLAMVRAIWFGPAAASLPNR